MSARGTINGVVYEIRETVLGPRHDPYSRHTITATNTTGKTVTYISCGLAGTWLEVDGEKLEDKPGDEFHYRTGVTVDQIYEHAIEQEDDEDMGGGQ
jgi:hypothetical protein